MRWDIFYHYGACSNDGFYTDGDTGEDEAIRANPYAVRDDHVPADPFAGGMRAYGIDFVCAGTNIDTWTNIDSTADGDA